MSEQDNRKNTMYAKIPEVARLNKVPGFNPLQFLRPVISEKTQERLLKLDLRYQKLWFRLAHPKGKMKLNALRITDQIAIFEAQVFFDRSDNEPISNFIASLTREENLDYIKAAQEKALNTALSDAGFGLQFADVSVGREGEDYGCVIPAAETQAEGTTAKADVVVAVDASIVKADSLPAAPAVGNPKVESLPVAPAVGNPKAESLPVAPAAENSQTESLLVTSATGKTPSESLPITPAAEKIPVESLPIASVVKTAPADSLPASPSAATRQEPPQTADATDENKTVSFARPLAAAMATSSELPVSASVQEETPAAKAAAPVMEQGKTVETPRYTADMPVEEIIALMTYEEAQAVRVDKGVCEGWTVGEVADKRTPSLKFYVYGNGNNNILRAAAKIMLDSLADQKAS